MHEEAIRLIHLRYHDNPTRGQVKEAMRILASREGIGGFGHWALNAMSSGVRLSRHERARMISETYVESCRQRFQMDSRYSGEKILNLLTTGQHSARNRSMFNAVDGVSALRFSMGKNERVVISNIENGDNHGFINRETRKIVLWNKVSSADAQLIEAVAQDPVAEIVRMGRETKKCPFCNNWLADGAGVNDGYGPDCARRYGLV